MKKEINSLTAQLAVQIDGAWLPAWELSCDGGNSELHVLNGKPFGEHKQRTGAFKTASSVGAGTAGHVWL